MSTEIVMDSSVIVALVTLEDFSGWARKKISEHGYFHILELNYYEVANALRYKQSDKFNAGDAEEAFSQAVELMNQFGVHSFGEVVVDAMTLALELNIAVYDAAFLSLADKLDMRLLTLDIRLAKRLENTKYCGLIEYPNKQ
jgi:predicted nucleic acid-binding protein